MNKKDGGKLCAPSDWTAKQTLCAKRSSDGPMNGLLQKVRGTEGLIQQLPVCGPSILLSLSLLYWLYLPIYHSPSYLSINLPTMCILPMYLLPYLPVSLKKRHTKRIAGLNRQCGRLRGHIPGDPNHRHRRSWSHLGWTRIRCVL